MSPAKPAVANGIRIGEFTLLGIAGLVDGFGMKSGGTVPTGQWVINSRGGDFAPWALASRLRSMILSPTAPPTPRRNERRLNL